MLFSFLALLLTKDKIYEFSELYKFEYGWHAIFFLKLRENSELLSKTLFIFLISDKGDLEKIIYTKALILRSDKPKTFWTSVKKLQGIGDKIKAIYIKDHCNRPVYDNGKEEEITDIFRILDKENQNFDQRTDRVVRDYMTVKENDISYHYRTSCSKINDQFEYISRQELDVIQ